MNLEEILDLILQGLTLIGIVFAVYFYIRKPQEKSERNDEVFSVLFSNLEKTVANLRDNHIHTLDSKLDSHIRENQTKAIEDARAFSRLEALLDQLLKK